MKFYSNNHILIARIHQLNFSIALNLLISNRFLDKFRIYICLKKIQKEREEEEREKAINCCLSYSNIWIISVYELSKLLKLSDLSELSKLLELFEYNRITRIIRISHNQFESWIAAASEHSGYLLNIPSGIRILQPLENAYVHAGEHTQHQTRRNESATEQFRWRDKEKTETRQRHRQSRWHTGRRNAVSLDAFALTRGPLLDRSDPWPIDGASRSDSAGEKTRTVASWRADAGRSPRYRGSFRLAHPTGRSEPRRKSAGPADATRSRDVRWSVPWTPGHKRRTNSTPCERNIHAHIYRTSFVMNNVKKSRVILSKKTSI